MIDTHHPLCDQGLALLTEAADLPPALRDRLTDLFGRLKPCEAFAEETTLDAWKTETARAGAGLAPERTPGPMGTMRIPGGATA